MTQETENNLRPTKKQKELLEFIKKFIAAHGYSPSYREIMHGLQYNSVATVSLHVNNLVSRGHLQKRDKSARSLEVVGTQSTTQTTSVQPKQLKTSEEKWLVDKVEIFFKEAESGAHIDEKDIDRLYVLTGALKVLGLEGAAHSYVARLSEIKKKHKNNQYAV